MLGGGPRAQSAQYDLEKYMRHRGRKSRMGAKLSKKQARQVKTIVGRQIETKFSDYDLPAFIVTAGGSIVGPIAIIGPGDGESQREGDEIILKNIRIRFSLIGQDATNFMRVIVFRWLQDNALNIPVIADIFQQVATNPWSANLDYSNLHTEKRIQILYDGLHSLVLNGNNACKHKTINVFGKKLGKKKMGFNTATTTGMGQVYICAISDSIASGPTFSVTARTTSTG